MALRIDEWRLKMTENVNSVMGKLRGVADKTVGKFTSMQDRLNRSTMRGVASLRDGLSGAANVASESFSEFKQNMLGSLPLPGALSNGLAGLAGPLGIAIGLTAVLALGLVKGVEAAEQFGRGFRELRNLNMNLDASGIAELKSDLLDLSKAKGLDPQKVTAGYYDIQSATGKTGKEVLDLVGRIGEASRALNMDMATSINGVGKAMVAFGLGTESLDAILASNAKTVQMGIVTFDQLAKSQTEYAGAAASVNQTVDSANKLFAIMTQHTKSAEIAATYTKGAFAELTRESTVKGLKKIGVSVFDANNQMRQADDILRDLVPQLSGMSDLTFARMKEEIGGSEGLRAMLDAAKSSGADTLRVLDGFDASSFDVNKAIQQANGDLDVMKDKLTNSIQVELIRVGEVFMPYLVRTVDGLISMTHHISAFVGWLREGWHWMKNVYDNSMLVRGVVQALFLSVETGWNALKTVIDLAVQGLVAPIKSLGQALSGDIEGAFNTLKDYGKSAWSTLFDQGASTVANAKSRFDQVLGTPVTVPVVPEMLSAPAPAAVAAASIGAVPGMPAQPAAPAGDVYASRFGPAGANSAGGDGVRQGVSEVVGGGKQVRNVNVTIQSLIKEVKVVTTSSVREGTGEIQRMVTEAMVNAVRGGELALMND